MQIVKSQPRGAVFYGPVHVFDVLQQIARVVREEPSKGQLFARPQKTAPTSASHGNRIEDDPAYKRPGLDALDFSKGEWLDLFNLGGLRSGPGDDAILTT